MKIQPVILTHVLSNTFADPNNDKVGSEESDRQRCGFYFETVFQDETRILFQPADEHSDERVNHTIHSHDLSCSLHSDVSPIVPMLDFSLLGDWSNPSGNSD